MSDMEEVEYDYDEDVAMSDDEEDATVTTSAKVESAQPSTGDLGAHKKTGLPHAGLAVSSKTNQDFRCLTAAELQAQQHLVIMRVAEVLNISEDQAAVLLLSFKWDKERLDETFWADPEKTCVKAGAIQGRVGWLDPAKLKTAFPCPILFDDVPYERTLSMGCEPAGQEEHRFSLDGWTEYLLVQLGDGANCLRTTCPKEGCPCVVSPRVWRMVLTEATGTGDATSVGTEQELQARQDALLRYERFLATNFVDINRKIKWCPSAGCSMALECNVPNAFVKCSGCEASFCFACRMDAHAPLSCEALKSWDAKCVNESETANWFIANTKCCPKCKTAIEKANGCNHMTCTMGGCRFEFCWTCLGPWSEHGSASGGYYQCNKFDSKAQADRLAGSAKAKHQLERYLHYYTRFEGHKSALKFAQKQRADSEERMAKYQRSTRVAETFNERVQALSAPAGWIDVQFIKDAVEQLIECRRVLMYTYAYAYYLEEGPRKDLFEYNQAMLESNTEKLSELSEACDKNAESVNRTEVINFTRVTGNFLRKMLEDAQPVDL